MSTTEPEVALTMVRWKVLKHLVNEARKAMAVPVEYGYPGKKYIKAEHVWAGDIDGAFGIPVFGDPDRMEREDEFEIPFTVRVSGRRDLDSTMERLVEIAAVFENVLANSPSLEDMPGVISAEGQTSRMSCGNPPGGRVGFLEFVIAVESRLL